MQRNEYHNSSFGPDRFVLMSGIVAALFSGGKFIAADKSVPNRVLGAINMRKTQAAGEVLPENFAPELESRGILAQQRHTFSNG